MSSTLGQPTAQDEFEQQNMNTENTPPQLLQIPTTSVISTQIPILSEHPYMGSTVEDDMIGQIDMIIRRVLTRPNHQSPYRYNFQWTINEEPNLNYTVILSIKEPSSILN